MAKLYFYYSAMNAGKSTMLLQSRYNYHERGMATLIFTPLIDDRYSVGKVYSRIGIEAEAIAFKSEDNLFTQVQTACAATPDLKCVLIDEAQFLSKAQVLQLSDIVDELDIPVIAYGLRTDFRGDPFEGSLQLLAWADELCEIKTICHCGRKAIMNLRIDADNRPVSSGAQIEIGGNKRYLAVCRRHFKSGNTGK